ncbi:MAG: YceI family protein [Gemmatimonadaceae bacterium]
MRNFLRTAIIAFPLLVPSLGWAVSPELLSLQPESKLWVEGGSTIKAWSCKAGDVTAVIDGAPNAVSQVGAGEKGVKSVKVIVASEKMDCGNGTMNEHMKKALKVSDNPNIEFKLASYDVARGGEGVTGTLNGLLTLGGVTKPIAIAATGKTEGGALHVNGSYELAMTDYDLKPPTLMFGRIKVRDVVTVKFDLLLKN